MIQVVGLAAAFALIIILTAKRVNVALSIIIGSVALAILSGLSVQDFANLFICCLEDPQTLGLTLQVAAIGMLAFSMKETKLVDDLIRGLRTMVSSRALLAVIPAVIGLMQMPGGALLSAPLIDKEADELKLTPERKVAVNLTFRHIWFYVFPLTSTLILASGLSGIDIYQLILIQIPSFIFSIVMGYALFLRHLKLGPRLQGEKAYGIVVQGLAPIAGAIALNLAGLNLAASVMLGVLATFLIKRTRPSRAVGLLLRGIPWTSALSIVSVMMLRYTVEASEAIPVVFSILKEAMVPLVLFATLFPFIIAGVSGLAIAGAGISIPFILPLFHTNAAALVSMIVLSTYAGYYISPLHLCLVLSNQYYKAKIHEVYRLWIPYLFIVCGLGIILDMLILSR